VTAKGTDRYPVDRGSGQDMTGSFTSGPGHCRCKVSSGSQISPNTMFRRVLRSQPGNAPREGINEFDGLSFEIELL